jgi:hypothetical protein
MEQQNAIWFTTNYPISLKPELRPGIRVPVPPPRRAEVTNLAGGWYQWGSHTAQPVNDRIPGDIEIVYTGVLESVVLPEEFVLRQLSDLWHPLPRTGKPLPDRWQDLSDAQAERLLAFTQQWGAMAKPHPLVTDMLLSDFGQVTRDAAEGLAFEEFNRATLFMGIPDDHLPRFEIAHISDVYLNLRDLDRLAMSVAAMSEGTPLADIWEPALPSPDDSDHSERDSDEDPELAAYRRFFSALNRGLRQYQGGVSYERKSGQHGGLSIDLYDAGCLMVHNLLLDSVPLNRCERTGCNRPFFRQVGEAEHGQNRTFGVKYCSPGCRSAVLNQRSRAKKASRANSVENLS